MMEVEQVVFDCKDLYNYSRSPSPPQLDREDYYDYHINDDDDQEEEEEDGVDDRNESPPPPPQLELQIQVEQDHNNNNHNNYDQLQQQQKTPAIEFEVEEPKSPELGIKTFHINELDLESLEEFRNDDMNDGDELGGFGPFRSNDADDSGIISIKSLLPAPNKRKSSPIITNRVEVRLVRLSQSQIIASIRKDQDKVNVNQQKDSIGSEHDDDIDDLPALPIPSKPCSIITHGFGDLEEGEGERRQPQRQSQICFPIIKKPRRTKRRIGVKNNEEQESGLPGVLSTTCKNCGIAIPTANIASLHEHLATCKVLVALDKGAAIPPELLHEEEAFLDNNNNQEEAEMEVEEDSKPPPAFPSKTFCIKEIDLQCHEGFRSEESCQETESGYNDDSIESNHDETTDDDDDDDYVAPVSSKSSPALPIPRKQPLPTTPSEIARRRNLMIASILKTPVKAKPRRIFTTSKGKGINNNGQGKTYSTTCKNCGRNIYASNITSIHKHLAACKYLAKLASTGAVAVAPSSPSSLPYQVQFNNAKGHNKSGQYKDSKNKTNNNIFDAKKTNKKQQQSKTGKNKVAAFTSVPQMANKLLKYKKHRDKSFCIGSHHQKSLYPEAERKSPRLSAPPPPPPPKCTSTKNANATSATSFAAAETERAADPPKEDLDLSEYKILPEEPSIEEFPPFIQPSDRSAAEPFLLNPILTYATFFVSMVVDGKKQNISYYKYYECIKDRRRKYVTGKLAFARCKLCAEILHGPKLEDIRTHLYTCSKNDSKCSKNSTFDEAPSTPTIADFPPFIQPQDRSPPEPFLLYPIIKYLYRMVHTVNLQRRKHQTTYFKYYECLKDGRDNGYKTLFARCKLCSDILTYPKLEDVRGHLYTCSKNESKASPYVANQNETERNQTDEDVEEEEVITQVVSGLAAANAAAEREEPGDQDQELASSDPNEIGDKEKPTTTDTEPILPKRGKGRPSTRAQQALETGQQLTDEELEAKVQHHLRLPKTGRGRPSGRKGKSGKNFCLGHRYTLRRLARMRKLTNETKEEQTTRLAREALERRQAKQKEAEEEEAFEEDVLNCNLCLNNVCFESAIELQIHKQDMHPIPIAVGPSTSSGQQAGSNHEEENLIKCFMCGKMFKGIQSVNQHSAEEHVFM